MRARMALGLLCLMLAPVSASRLTGEEAWDRLLNAVGMTRQTCRFDFQDMANWGGDAYLLPYFHAMHADPLRIPAYARYMRESLRATAPSAGDLVMLAGARLNVGTRRTLLGDPLAEDVKQADSSDALAQAIEAAHAAGGKPLTPAQKKKLRSAIRPVPADVARNSALILRVELRALQWRNRALFRLAGHNPGQVFGKLMGANPDSDEAPDEELNTMRDNLDLRYLLVGGIDLALAADRAVTALQKRGGQERFAFDWDTPLGRISLHGAQEDTFAGDRAYLLSVDTAGNDTYYGGGATWDAGHPVSVLIDLAGNDRYLEAPGLANTPVAQSAGRKAGSRHPTFGAGVLGYGVLIDAAGDDLYRSLNQTQGRGFYGVGVLLDRAGRDQYDSYTQAQGAAGFGVGVLADLGGADVYRCFTTSQGFGDTMGCGLLVDTGSENDEYSANDTVLDFPSAQSPQHNGSLAQGAGFGRRADYLDGHSLAGGVGVLLDSGGSNTFTCGVFGQGTGYWYGVGMLLAGPGDDTFHGLWYVQGAAAHFAVGILHDTGGSDRYTATLNMAQGAGHDFSVGFLLDDAGKDRYEAPSLSLGGGNANGFGFFWDRAGDDTYIVRSSVTLGRSTPDASIKNTLRERNLTLGLFLDTGGSDTYPAEIPHARNNTLWTMRDSGPPPLPSIRGAGLDIEAPGESEPK